MAGFKAPNDTIYAEYFVPVGSSRAQVAQIARKTAQPGWPGWPARWLRGYNERAEAFGLTLGVNSNFDAFEKAADTIANVAVTDGAFQAEWDAFQSAYEAAISYKLRVGTQSKLQLHRVREALVAYLKAVNPTGDYHLFDAAFGAHIDLLGIPE